MYCFGDNNMNCQFLCFFLLLPVGWWVARQLKRMQNGSDGRLEKPCWLTLETLLAHAHETSSQYTVLPFLIAHSVAFNADNNSGSTLRVLDDHMFAARMCEHFLGFVKIDFIVLHMLSLFLALFGGGAECSAAGRSPPHTHTRSLTP